MVVWVVQVVVVANRVVEVAYQEVDAFLEDHVEVAYLEEAFLVHLAMEGEAFLDVEEDNVHVHRILQVLLDDFVAWEVDHRNLEEEVDLEGEV